MRTEAARLGLIADYSLDEVDERRHRPRPRRRRQPAAARRRGGARLAARRSTATTKWTTSVCTGSLVLGAAGLLEGKRATGQLALPRAAARATAPTRSAAASSRTARSITAAGVTAGIDMALHLVAREVGPEVAQAVQLGIEYDPEPPFDSGSPEKAPAEIVELVTAVAERQRQRLSLDPA